MRMRSKMEKGSRREREIEREERERTGKGRGGKKGRGKVYGGELGEHSEIRRREGQL